MPNAPEPARNESPYGLPGWSGGYQDFRPDWSTAIWAMAGGVVIIGSFLAIIYAYSR